MDAQLLSSHSTEVVHERLTVSAGVGPNYNVSTRELWFRFKRGELEIHSARYSLERCFVTLRQTRRNAARVRPVEWTCFERLLCGDQPKVVADELAVSRSTVCSYWRNAIEFLCEPGAVRRAGAFLVVCASSTRAAQDEFVPFHGFTEQGELVLSVSLANGRLKDVHLSPAEWEIARAVILGKAASEISRERNTSPRTVANQLNAIYRKLGISGRRELVFAALVRN